MRSLTLPLILIVLALAVPVVPFLVLGEGFEARVADALGQSLPPATLFAGVVGLLAVDLLLPIPSSVVSTVAGSGLGFALGTLASWLGLTISGLAGLGLARWFGRPLALRLADPDALRRIDAASRRFGPLVLVVARPVPLLAEASVLLLGTTDLPWRRMLAPLALSNLGLAAAYAALGTLVWMPVALAASIALPLALALAARRLWPPPAADAPSPPTAERSLP